MMNKVLIYAHKKGYVVNSDGEVLLKGESRSLRLWSKTYLSFTVRFYCTSVKKDVFRRVFVHRLQAFQKFGVAVFKPGVVVRHLNGNPKDNSYMNIMIGTASENSMDRDPDIRKQMAIVASYKNRVLSDEQVNLIKKDRESGSTYKKLKDKYGLSKSTLSYLFNKAKYAQ